MQLELVVTPDGKTDKIKVVASPSTVLATSAVRAVKGWRFKPSVGFALLLCRPTPEFVIAVRDGPVLFATLEMIERKVGQFSTTKSTAK